MASGLDSKKMPYYDISAKSNINLEKPFVWLARKVFGDNQLQLVEAPAPALQPPEFTMDEQTQQRYEAELAQAANKPLPRNGDNDL
jgi:GTP-binding nuclear protein Ran